MVLLAKQGWRLQMCTTSLVHKVFKTKYFPNGDFLSAELGHHPSYEWRSIFVAQDVVKHGHRWQVGNDQSIDIWNDKWLHQPSTFRLMSKPATIPTDAKVALLIDPHT